METTTQKRYRVTTGESLSADCCDLVDCPNGLAEGVDMSVEVIVDMLLRSLHSFYWLGGNPLSGRPLRSKKVLERRIRNQIGKALLPPPTCLKRSRLCLWEPVSQRLGRNAADNRIGRNIAGHDTAGCKYRTVANPPTPRQDRHPITYPDIMTDLQRIVFIPRNAVLRQQSKMAVVEERMHDRALHRVVPPPNDQACSHRTPGSDATATRQDAGGQNIAIAIRADLDAMKAAQDVAPTVRAHEPPFEAMTQGPRQSATIAGVKGNDQR